MPSPKKKKTSSSRSKPRSAKAGKVSSKPRSKGSKRARGMKPDMQNGSAQGTAAAGSAFPPTPAPLPQTDPDSHQRYPSVSLADAAKTLEFAIEVARMAADDRCEDVVVLDVRGLSQLSDFIIIASGTSDRQMYSVGDDIRKLAAERGFGVFRSSTDDRSTWIVVDCVDVVAHIFEPNTRAHYDLEMLWGDAPRIEWERPGQANRNRAGLD